MAKKIDNDLLYVTNSLLRIDVMYLLESAGFARNYEIAEMLCRKSTNVSRIVKGLCEHDLVDFETNNGFNFYFLTEKGKEIVNKLRHYHGLD